MAFSILRSLERLLRSEDGATIVEYGLLVALIAGIALVAVSATGTKLSDVFSSASSLLST